ncbi:zinc finger phd-type protein [Stemphylium lycopersici]|uniref:Zinc finger phd-type protein n=1 Tax=Stemphylium lycopersici TaxID=183478 RepID=A0A364NEI7_STELY|nr:zinc finger phd-type protein [Stemphylium lycopersici]
MPLRRPIERALKENDDFKPWDFNCNEELPEDLHWMKVKAPNSGEVLRWDGYQKCDIVLIHLEDQPPQYGMIVHAYDRAGKGPECVISWIYDRPRARKEFFDDWPEGVKYLLSNHFQLINSESFIQQAPWDARDTLLGNKYNWGINFGSNELDTFDESNNCIVKARRSMNLSVFKRLPRELRDICFAKWMSAESKDDHIKAKQAGPTSCSYYSGRRSEHDQRGQRIAVCLALQFEGSPHLTKREFMIKEAETDLVKRGMTPERRVKSGNQRVVMTGTSRQCDLWKSDCAFAWHVKRTGAAMIGHN